MTSRAIVYVFFSILSLSSIFAQAPVLNELYGSDLESADTYGTSIDMSEEHMVVGAPSVGGQESGAVYVYDKMDDGTLGNEQKLVPSDFSIEKRFGWAVSIQGDYIVVGAIYDQTAGPYTGAIYVYKKDETGTWGDEQKLVAPDGQSYDHFGESVSIFGDYLVVSAMIDDNSRGSAYIYKLDGDGQWNFLQKIVASDATIGGRYGSSVSLSSDYLIVGAYAMDVWRGAVYVYEKLPNGNWGNELKLEVGALTTADNAWIGRSIDIQGDVLVIGAPYDDGIETATGSAYVYEKDGNGDWEFKQKLILENGLQGDYFGITVETSDNQIIIGAIGNDAIGTDIGNAFLYRKDDNGVWSLAYSFPSPYIDASNFYGNSVSIFGSYFVIGASTHFSSSGRIYWGSLDPIITGTNYVLQADVAATLPAVCSSTGFIAVPEITDFCDGITTVEMFADGFAELEYTYDDDGNLTGGHIPAPGLEIGSHNILVHVTDACGAVSTENFVVEVVDGISPIAICQELTVLELSTDGIVVADASSFDDGTTDNCCLDYFEVRRMDEDTFGPSVAFDCVDAAVTVVFRAWDCHDNHSDCMVEVSVVDTVGAFCSAPADVSVSCDEYYDELITTLETGDSTTVAELLNGMFGSSVLGDNCSFVATHTVNVDVDQCGTGTINRYWTAADNTNEADNCFQKISVNPLSDWYVQFPVDTVVELNVECNDDLLDVGTPVISNNACEMIALSYTDYECGVPGSDVCYKVLRDWTAINWCTYDGGADDEIIVADNQLINVTDDDYATFTQIIEVTDSTPPVMAATTASYLVDADTASIEIAVADVEGLFSQDLNCNSVNIVHNYNDLTNYMNLSGTTFTSVPVGLYTVIATAVDGCGNVTTIATTVSVESEGTTTSVHNLQNGANDLFQNQPNPYNGSTIIGVLLEKSSSGTLSIMDTRGRLVREIKQVFEKGYSEISISGLYEPGMYYYTLQTPHFVSTKKMLVIN